MKLGYVIVYVPDVAAALAFYETAFGMPQKFLHESGEYGELDTGGTTLAFAVESLIESHGVSFRPNRPNEVAAAVEISLITEDVSAAFNAAVSAGAEGVVQPKAQPWGQTICYVRDLNGVLVEIGSPMH